jgi:ABC-type Na+ transport system ATPase subunit NatA
MLKGRASSGKTTTLNMVYDALITSCGAVAGPKVPVQNTAGNAAKNDIDVVLWYKHKYIAVYSHGDVQQDCNTIIGLL